MCVCVCVCVILPSLTYYVLDYSNMLLKVLPIGGRGKLPPPPPPKAPSFSTKRRVAREKERGREREEVGNVYYLGAMIISVN